jgi:hypothetical protein
MTTEKVIWTALPNGTDESGRLHISVHVAPRLSNDDGSDTERKLGEFAAFANWPDRLNSLRFDVEFQGGPKGRGVPEQPADPDLWKLLFPAETPVRPFEFQDHSQRDFHVFPVRPVLQFLEQAYGATGAAGTDLPSIDDPFGPLAHFTPLAHVTNRITDSQSFWQELARAKQPNKPPGKVRHEQAADYTQPSGVQATQNAFFEAYRFYYRPGNQRPDFPDDYIEKSPPPHDFDFHEMVSSLADHPALLRRLGLVIDLVVELDPAQVVPPSGVVRVIPRGDVPEKPPTCPGTRYDYDGRWFGARPKNNQRMNRGILRLSQEFYDLFQVDVDGAAMHAIDFAAALEAMKDPEHRSDATPDQAGVPALRSGGLAIARINRADVLLEELKDKSGKNKNIEVGVPVILDAEDLIRGYRIDVLDQDAPGGGRWFSLHRRATEHTIKPPAGGAAPKPIKVTDEGYIKATSASSENAEHPTPSDDLYLHETLFGWEGWSLSVARPGKRIVEPGEGDTGSNISRYDPDEGNPFPLVSTSAVEGGTLPRLRLGHTYRMRARTVDLAGNSRAFSEHDLDPLQPDLRSEAQAYLRFEPVPSPTVLRRHLDTEGESLEKLAIRSNLGISPGDYANLPAVQQALTDAGAAHVYAADSQRHLAPPKASQQAVEQDGRLDPAFGGTPADVSAALHVSLREEGTFLDPTIVDVATGQKTVVQAPISLFPPGTPMPPTRGAGLPGGAYAYYAGPEVVLPYLPDSLAIGVALTGYDFTGAEVLHQIAPFAGAWPQLTPFRLRLSEGPLAAAFAGNVLEVTLPKAEVVWARLSSVFPDGRLEDMAIWQWIPAPDRTAALHAAAIDGRHWMLTPFRNLTFTHAVQQPLVVPDMTKVVSTRALGNTYADFRGPVINHAKSTGRLDVFGAWTEDVDLITDDEPRMKAFASEVHHRAQAFGFEITRYEDAAEVAKHAARHEFGDTKYRHIVYHSVATTRFREFLPRPLTDVPANIQRVEPTTDGGGTVKSLLIHDVPSSSRPAAPDILYVLPTFRWERQNEGNQRKHVRYGKAVRVWMRRPWFSSGDGEQLGVILEPGVPLPRGWARQAAFETMAHLLARQPQVSLGPLRRVPQPGDAPPAAAGGAQFLVQASNLVSGAALSALAGLTPSPAEAKTMLRPYTTAWGLDPVWESALPDEPPTVAAFPRHSGYAVGLTLEELPHTVAVVVAAHDVYYDRGRKLWYCDIEIDAGDTYFPFARLALARYQAHSVTNAHLSRVVMTDFIQLAPDRTAEVMLTPAAAQVKVEGFSGRNTLANVSPIPQIVIDVGLTQTPRPNTTMRVALQRRVAGVPGDLGWQTVGAETTLTASHSGYHVTWTGQVALPAGALDSDQYRLFVAEVETFFRDLIPGDPMISTSPLDFVRERVVYADTFELNPAPVIVNG